MHSRCVVSNVRSVELTADGSRRSGSRSDERGVALVEFALILPVLTMLIFALITGGIAYDRNLGISYSAQQTARFASTLPLSSYASTDDWLDAVHQRVVDTSEGHLVQDAPGRNICVAYVDPDGGATRSRTVTVSDGSVARNATTCFADGLPSSEVRVQVSLSRADEIDLVLFGGVDLTLSKDVITRFEAAGA